MAPLLKLKVRAVDFDIQIPDLCFLQILEADLHRLHALENSVQWLLFVAQGIWISRGALYYCHDNASPYDEAETASWLPCLLSDELKAGHYEYRRDPAYPMTPFLRIENKSDTSATNDSQGDQSKTFRREIFSRDNNLCVVTGFAIATNASHVVPKRLGDAVTRSIFKERGYATETLNKWSPENGLCMFVPVDTLFDHFRGSFYPLSQPYEYRFHSFDPESQAPVTVIPDRGVLCDIHQVRCELQPRSDIPAPPDGIMTWHYVQTVLKTFATAMFKKSTAQYHNIAYREETGSTDDSYYSFDINESPLTRLDHARYVRNEALAKEAHLEEKNESVRHWLASATGI